MAAHRYWRLNVIENWGNFYAGKGAVATIDLRVSSGGSNLATTGNGTASASTEVVGFEASKAFDGNVDTYWQSGDAATANSQWIKWDFGAGNEKDINYVALTNGNEAAGSQLIKRWTLYFSDDNNNWTPWMYSTSNNPSSSNDTPTAWSWSSSMVPAATLSAALGTLSFTGRLGGKLDAVLGTASMPEAYGGRSLNTAMPFDMVITSRVGWQFAASVGTMAITGVGSESENGKLDALLGALSMQARAGAHLDADLGALRLTAQGSFWNVGRLNESLGSMALAGRIVVGNTAALSAVLARMELDAFGAGRGSGTLGEITLSGSMRTGNVGRLSARLAVFELEASGTQRNYGRLDALLGDLQMVNAGRADMALGALRLTAIGHAVVTVTYQGWAMNLKPGQGMPHQVSEYTNFPFNQIIRFGDDYYGVADDGLYLLGGDTDYDTPTPAKIGWRVRGPVVDFGDRQMKVVRESFIYGRLGPTVTAKVSIGEGADQSYPAEIQRGSTAQAHRVKYGRGLKAVYWQFELADAAGSALNLDRWLHEPQPTSRKI